KSKTFNNMDIVMWGWPAVIFRQSQAGARPIWLENLPPALKLAPDSSPRSPMNRATGAFE
ncbi:MAG TPA: hypothetical protein VHC19_30145, partial [Pirellulales bacterium]|nr:hypothetical protein [Pirellulales bacterium]